MLNLGPGAEDCRKWESPKSSTPKCLVTRSSYSETKMWKKIPLYNTYERRNKQRNPYITTFLQDRMKKTDKLHVGASGKQI